MKLTKYKLVYLTLVVLLVASTLSLGSAVGCGPATPKDILIGTHEAGSSFYVYGAAIADLVSKYTDYTGKTRAVAGSAVWLPMMETKEVQFGLETFHGMWQAYHGEKPFPQAYDNRLVLIGGGINVGLYVREESAVRTRADIRGLKIGCEYSGTPHIHTYATGEIANAGLTWNDVQCMPRTALYAGQREDVTEKRLDVFYASIGSGVTTELDAAIGIRFLGLDPSPAAMAKMREAYPAVITQVQPGPPGIDEPMWLAYLPSYLVAHASVDNKIVYELAKVTWEHYAELGQVDPRMKSWVPKGFLSDQATIPYHPGAIKFYKEQGVWTSEMEQVQKRLLAEK
ncbi:TAXI family TRAP transporter solute-binding subunit [Chloroflexota bacterium]